MKLPHENRDWRLNIPLEKLSVNQRKESLILLFFLNLHKEEIRAFNELKIKWIDTVYKLPKTSSESYDTIKNGRYVVLKRMKELFNKYMVKP
jgi:hypothetical protein